MSEWGATVTDDSDEFGEALDAAHERAIFVTGQNVRNRAKEHASGRPGPRVITNRLRSSIESQVKGSGSDAFAEIGSDVVYALPLETSDRTPYPFLKPGMYEHLDEHARLYAETLEAAMP